MDSHHAGGPWRELGDGGTGHMVHRCPALRPEVHPYSGPFQGFFGPHQKHSTLLSEATGTDCEPNRSAVLAKQQHQPRRSADQVGLCQQQWQNRRILPTLLTTIVMIVGNELLFLLCYQRQRCQLFWQPTVWR